MGKSCTFILHSTLDLPPTSWKGHMLTLLILICRCFWRNTKYREHATYPFLRGCSTGCTVIWQNKPQSEQQEPAQTFVNMHRHQHLHYCVPSSQLQRERLSSKNLGWEQKVLMNLKGHSQHFGTGSAYVLAVWSIISFFSQGIHMRFRTTQHQDRCT